jgi:predicted RNase H-like nuclease (RuvC/YqgF family)
MEKKLSESETLHVKARNTQARYEEDNERLKEQIGEQKALIASLQQENKRLDGEAAEQKKLANKLEVDVEKLTQDMKVKVNELQALKR